MQTYWVDIGDRISDENSTTFGDGSKSFFGPNGSLSKLTEPVSSSGFTIDTHNGNEDNGTRISNLQDEEVKMARNNVASEDDSSINTEALEQPGQLQEIMIAQLMRSRRSIEDNNASNGARSFHDSANDDDETLIESEVNRDKSEGHVNADTSPKTSWMSVVSKLIDKAAECDGEDNNTLCSF